MTTRRPAAVIAHFAGTRLFTDHDLEQLAEVVDLLDPEPIGRWDDPRAVDLLGRAEVIIGHWGCPRLDVAALDLAPRLGLFAYAAGTVKGVVTEAVFDRGVRVTSGARANAEPVAEFTLAAILFANKAVFWQRVAEPRSGHDAPVPAIGAVGNWSKTVGIVGASLVGRRVIELLAPFPQLDVLLYDPYVDVEEAIGLGVTKCALDDLCARADVLSIHAPDLPATRKLIGAAQLSALRDGATVINTARPAIIDQDALVDELSTRRLFAVLDVTDPEPLPDDHPLRRLPNAFVTPHVSGSQGTELTRMTVHLIEEIRRWVAGEPGYNEIHLGQLDRLA